MKFFNGTKYNESAKSAENDFLHLLVNDNGTFTVSHKESGRVFFETPTLLIGQSDTYSYCTHADVQKCRRDKGVIFDITQKLNAPIIHNGNIPPINQPIAFMNTVIMDDSDDTITMTCSLCLPDGFFDNGYEAIIRFPSGIDAPTVNSLPLSEVTFLHIPMANSITLTDENGENVSVLNTSDFDLDVSVTEDGNIDVYIPSNAPVNEIGLLDFGFVISFA